MEFERISIEATELKTLSANKLFKERQIEALEVLKNKLLEILNLKPSLDHDFLLRFLIHAKYDVNKAFKRLRYFYKTRKKYANVFQHCYPSTVMHVSESKHISALPFRAPDNSVIITFDRNLCDLQKISFDEMFLFDTMVIDSLLSNPVTQEYGLTIILEGKNIALRHIIADGPKGIRMFVDTFQNAVPVRIQAVHFVNTHYAVEVFYNIVSPFLSTKIKKRVHFYSGVNSWKKLHQFIPPDLLPEEYGGTVRVEEMVDLGLAIEGKDEFYKKRLQYGFVD